MGRPTVEEALKRVEEKAHARKILDGAEDFMVITCGHDGIQTSVCIGERLFTMLGAIEVAKSRLLKDIEAHALPLVDEEEEQ